jgi:hypothetical protein
MIYHFNTEILATVLQMIILFRTLINHCLKAVKIEKAKYLSFAAAFAGLSCPESATLPPTAPPPLLLRHFV